MTKIHIYSTCVLPVLLYGSETSTLLAEDSRRVQAFHMTCQRCILGIQWHDFVTNEDVHRHIKLSNVLKIITRRCHLLFGYVRRLETRAHQHTAPSDSVLTAAAYQASKWLKVLCQSALSLVDLATGGGPGSICPGVVEGRREPEVVGGSTTLQGFTRMIKVSETVITNSG